MRSLIDSYKNLFFLLFFLWHQSEGVRRDGDCHESFVFHVLHNVLKHSVGTGLNETSTVHLQEEIHIEGDREENEKSNNYFNDQLSVFHKKEKILKGFLPVFAKECKEYVLGIWIICCVEGTVYIMLFEKLAIR